MTYLSSESDKLRLIFECTCFDFRPNRFAWPPVRLTFGFLPQVVEKSMDFMMAIARKIPPECDEAEA